MTYEVVSADAFRTALEQHLSYLSSEGASHLTIEAWYRRLVRALGSLKSLPSRYPVARDESIAVGVASSSSGSRMRRGIYS